MYNAFFGFTQNPFNMSPDPSFLFRSPQHEEALANLIYGVQSRRALSSLTGEVGTGKTTMLECLRDFLTAQQIAFASLFNSRLTSEQFFEMLAYDLDLRCNRTSKTEVLLCPQQHADRAGQRGPNTVLIVDEAHNLEWEVLEEIRLLGQSGEPPRQAAADHPGRPAGTGSQAGSAGIPPTEAADRLAVHAARLRACRRASTTSIRAWRGPACRTRQVFPPEILDEIHFRAQGIPRLINAVCDNLLLTAFAMESRVATLEMLDEVTADMRLDYPGQRPFRPQPTYVERVLRESH